MKTLSFSSALLLYFCVSVGDTASTTVSTVAFSPPPFITVGETLALPGARDLWIEDGKVLEGRDHGHRIVVHGKTAGASLVRFNGATYEVNVLGPRAAESFRCLEAQTAKSLSLRPRAREGATELAGTLIRYHEWKRITRGCVGKTTWKSRFETPVALRSTLVARMKADLRREGLAKVEFRWAPYPVALTAPGQKISSGAERWLRDHGLELEQDPTMVATVPQVRIRVLIAEIRRDQGIKLGIQWPDGFNAALLPNQYVPNEDLFVRANFLETQGLGQTLARPELLTRSGSEAEFWAGGEFPIKLVGLRTRDVVWKKYGILLKVKPQADAMGRVSVGLSTEISSIDMSRAVDGVPGLLMNRVETHFDLDRPRTIALSGLIHQENGSSLQGLPGLAQLPILGKLFSSQDYRDSRSELVILVRPQVVDPAGGAEVL